MRDRDHAIEALEHPGTRQPPESGESAIEQYRQNAIEHVKTLVVELEKSTQRDEEWQDELEAPREKAGKSASKGTTKTINDGSIISSSGERREGQEPIRHSS